MAHKLLVRVASGFGTNWGWRGRAEIAFIFTHHAVNYIIANSGFRNTTEIRCTHELSSSARWSRYSRFRSGAKFAFIFASSAVDFVITQALVWDTYPVIALEFVHSTMRNLNFGRCRTPRAFIGLIFAVKHFIAYEVSCNTSSVVTSKLIVSALVDRSWFRVAEHFVQPISAIQIVVANPFEFNTRLASVAGQILSWTQFQVTRPNWRQGGGDLFAVLLVRAVHAIHYSIAVELGGDASTVSTLELSRGTILLTGFEAAAFLVREIGTIGLLVANNGERQAALGRSTLKLEDGTRRRCSLHIEVTLLG